MDNNTYKSCLIFIIALIVTLCIMIGVVWSVCYCFDYTFKWKYVGLLYFLFVCYNICFYHRTKNN